MDLRLFEARAANDLEGAFTAINEAGLRELLILIDPLFAVNIRKLVELSNKNRLITMNGYRSFVDAGGLMSYGPNYRDIYKHCATYINRILKGASPADLPVEQPTKFEFIVNSRTAKALNFTIPNSLLTFADEVICGGSRICNWAVAEVERFDFVWSMPRSGDELGTSF